MPLPQNDAKFYDEYYFKHCCGAPYERNEMWAQVFGRMADAIARQIKPRTALDAGCAMGLLVEELRARGIEAFGIDISEYALGRVRADLKPYCRRASILDPLPQRYDLIVCIEVAEHLPALDAERAIANLCQASDDILFCSTPFDYREPTHLNVQPPEYWAELFARCGFYRDVDFDASFITPWAARFRLRRDPVPRVARDYERRFWLLWKENNDLRNQVIEMRNQLAEDDPAARGPVNALSAQIAFQQETIDALNAQLAEIANSRGWRWLTWLRRIRAQIGSARLEQTRQTGDGK